jgi:hypothetical protein
MREYCASLGSNSGQLTVPLDAGEAVGFGAHGSVSIMDEFPELAVRLDEALLRDEVGLGSLEMLAGGGRERAVVVGFEEASRFDLVAQLLGFDLQTPDQHLLGERGAAKLSRQLTLALAQSPGCYPIAAEKQALGRQWTQLARRGSCAFMAR